ncbi:perlucin-like [Diabrotica virgifera virgifera]|uniref:C-type lectin domain-containing protein n=1 Tax=Diabrotica virgifera virgifera TaxID=50390 RepID=A0ABM5KTH4_DIAVI|nr:perlucin-like [Diabrotica virgifera virgifera]
MESLNFCETIHMKLASINSARENNKIAQFARQAGISNLYWIGGARFVDNVKWLWIPYGREVDYSNWAAGHPVKNTLNCILGSNWGVGEQFTWVVGDCYARLNFICERYVDDVGSTLGGATLS